MYSTQRKHPSRRVTKWVNVDTERIENVLRRIRAIQISRPAGVVTPVFTSTSISKYGRTLVRIGAPLVEALSLEQIQRRELPQHAVFRQIAEDLMHWRRVGFIHGDLAPRNILVENTGKTIAVHYVDWILDTERDQIYSKYRSKSKPTFEGDEFALEVLRHDFCIRTDQPI